MRSLSDFAGDWQVSRRIEDRLAGQVGVFEGTARFTPDADGLRYREEGVLQFPGLAPMQATRDYLWRQTPGGIAVCFADGRAFHHIDAAQTDSHWCDPDTYRVAYDFADWPRWQAVWDVSGPRKTYTMTSRYTPASGAPAPAKRGAL